jgi:hypothetical protein
MVIFHSYVSLPEGNFFVAKLRESIIENRKTECREAKNISQLGLLIPIYGKIIQKFQTTNQSSITFWKKFTTTMVPWSAAASNPLVAIQYSWRWIDKAKTSQWFT